MIKVIPALMLLLLTQGCVGLGVIKTQSETFHDPFVGCQPGVYALAPRQTNTVVYTDSWLKANWDTPTSIKHTGAGDQDEIWVYKFGLAWNGVVPIVLIPIPLVLPTGKEQVQFALHQGHVISGTQCRSHSAGGAFGFTFFHTLEFGAFSLGD
jgi:hypothetical protein